MIGSILHRIAGFFASAAAVALALSVCAASQAATVTTRSGLHEGFGRLVFEWSEPTGYGAEQRGRELHLRFERPAPIDPALALETLSDYLEGLSSSGDPRVLVLRLKEGVEYRASAYDQLVVVDFYEGAAPARTAGQEPLERVGVRVGAHDGFDRIVFDWPEPVGFVIEREAEALAIRFDRAGALDAGSLAERLPDWVRPGRVDRLEDSLTVNLRVPPSTEYHAFTDGPAVALDLTRPVEPIPATALEAEAVPWSVASLGDRPEALSANPAYPTSLVALAPAAGPQERAAEPASTAPAPVATPGSAPKALSAGPAPLIAPAASVSAPGIGVSLLPKDTGLELRFAWDRPSAAALFRRGAHLWLVFDQARSLVLPDLEAPWLRAHGIEAGEVLEQQPTSVVRFELAPGFDARAKRAGEDWIVEIARAPQAPEHVLPVRVEATEGGIARVVVPEQAAGPVLALTDPEVGDRLLVVPLSKPGYGVAPGRAYSEFELLASSQGVAVRPLRDDVRVETASEGVVITAARGLFLSPSSAETAADARLAEPPLDLKAWRVPDIKTVEETRLRLVRALALVDEEFRTAARLNLASFYVANDFFADALGVLEMIEREDPNAAASPRFHALKGVALVHLKRFREAEQALALPAFEGRPDIALWRGLAAAGRRDWVRAKELFREADAAFFDLPTAWRGRIEIAAARADCELRDPVRAAFHLNKAEEAGYPATLQGHFDYLRGCTYALLNNPERALATWDKVIASDSGEAHAEARIARTELLLRRRNLTDEQAIAELESIRFSWRGDAVEQRLLDKLGELYLKQGNYDLALAAWRTATEGFEDSPLTPVIKKRMAEVFVEVHGEAKKGRLGSVDAAGLFYEFRNLTPEGREGDDMVRTFADRLVAMDLLPRATALLEAQVEQRLSGIDKARVGTRLAVIQLLDGNASGALHALKISDIAQEAMPLALAAERRLLEARALFGIGRIGEALALLDGDGRKEALWLAADIYWSRNDWAALAAALLPIYGGARALPGFAKDDELYLAKLALALALSGARAELVALAADYGEAMRDSAYGAAFRVATANDPSSDMPFLSFVDAVSDIAPIEAFLEGYRQKIKTAGLSGLN